MKKYLLILTMLVFANFAKAQVRDITIYFGCNPNENDGIPYKDVSNIGQQQQQVITKQYPDCNKFKLPHYPGKAKDFNIFLAKNLKWKSDFEAQGSVFISFVVEKDGRLTHIIIIHGLTSALNKEALRVIKLSPRWVSAIGNGKPVRSLYTMPIRFSLQE